VSLSTLPAGHPLPIRNIHGSHFCWRLSRPQIHSAVGRFMSNEKTNNIIGNRARDLPACSIMPQPTTLPLSPLIIIIIRLKILWHFLSIGHWYSSLSELLNANLHAKYCHLKGHLFKLGLTADPFCERCLGDDEIKYIHLMWLWGGRLHKIPSLGSVLFGTKWLLWRPHRQSPTFHSKCGINQGLIKRGSTIDH
jgi:hypothetical protein